MNLLGGILSKLPAKEKEVVATVSGYDYVTRCMVANVKGTNAIIPWEDINIYQRKYMNRDANINDDYIHRLIGAPIRCEIIKFDKGEYILSRSKVMQKRLNKFNKGDVVEAVVVSASARALYLEFDEGLSGIMYINQLTSAKVERPLDIYSIGDKIKCKIIKKKDGGLFELSRLELYNSVTLNLQRGEIIKCKITQKERNGTGFFVEVKANPLYSGIFDLNAYNRNNKYRIGDSIELRIVEIKENKKQLRLRTCY